MSDKCLTAGTQCIAKVDNTKPKPQELRFLKGDVFTIINKCHDRGWYHALHHASGLEGLVSASAVRERPPIKIDQRLSLMPWFHGSISGHQAVQQLQSKEEGAFLLRESVRHPGDYVLCVSHNGEVIHYRICYQDGKLSIDLKKTFSNLIDLIEYYMVNQGVLATKLMKPKTKQGAKSAEEELAKAGWLLNVQHLIFREKIGEGEFGDVLKGMYMGQPVAIKNIKCDVTAKNFLEETTTMTQLKHKNLVNLLGVVLHNGLYLVMELMSKGNLVSYLRSRGRNNVPLQQLLHFSVDIAQGMEYLEEKRLVHRDLAARNILLSENVEAKISDFGLSKSKLSPEDLTRLPIKWTAPEALLHNSVREVVEKVPHGYRMDAPENCQPVVYTLMKCCWEDDPAKRPSFKKLREKLEKIVIGM
ncbi:megakaryocyte-associated tyrosine-protein kinase isoform X2 [Hyla sarda]|uniref:megakaryocyte-associated tyrosine-protein kinase isoform X2 n=1 Tax=Hyla sarda TaxID=327740 RepID=UPI0024C3618F|nr:megakaryocyte-associated tyrosine-protein kinase isoform X2 [Hyla sarda]